MKPIEKLSRRHLINSSDVFVIKGFTVLKLRIDVKIKEIADYFKIYIIPPDLGTKLRQSRHLIKYVF